MTRNTKIFIAVIVGMITLSMMTVCIAIAVKIAEFGHISTSGYVAVVDLEGVIMDSRPFLLELEELSEDDLLKAVVVRINSPGGLVAPSEEIHYALKELDKKIPVIASMASVAASGGYYAAVATRKIYANAGTLTASIGVIMELANTERLFQWAKIDRFVLKAGKFKDIGSSIRKMTADEEALLQAMLTNMHDDFRAKVKEGRKLTDADLENVADGRVMTGLQALQAKLVDEIGPIEKAIAHAKKEAGLEDDAYVHYPEEEEGLLRRVILGETLGKVGRLVDHLSQFDRAPGPRFMFLMSTP